MTRFNRQAFESLIPPCRQPFIEPTVQQLGVLCWIAINRYIDAPPALTWIDDIRDALEERILFPEKDQS